MHDQRLMVALLELGPDGMMTIGVESHGVSDDGSINAAATSRVLASTRAIAQRHLRRASLLGRPTPGIVGATGMPSMVPRRWIGYGFLLARLPQK